MNELYIDIETTGLNPKTDEILEIAITTESGVILFNSLIKPSHAKEWKEAEKINGISVNMVKHSPTLNEVSDDLQHILSGKKVYAWNAKFDHSFLQKELAESTVVCAMAEFGDYIERTQPQNKSQSGRYKMANTAKDLGINALDAHRALGDIKTMIKIRQTYQNPNFNRTDLDGSKYVEAYEELAC